MTDLLKALCMFGCLSTVVCGKNLWFTMENETRLSLHSPEKQSSPASRDNKMQAFTDSVLVIVVVLFA